MAPLREQTILVTGSTDGIGKLVATHLAMMGASVLIHGRDPEKCRAVEDEIWKLSGNPRLDYFVSDFSSLQDVRHMVTDFHDHHDRLDVLINNAGVLPMDHGNAVRHFSAQEYDLCFSVNYLAPFLLTHGLLPALLAAPSPRIVNVASAAQEPIDFEDVMSLDDYSPMRAYGRSKLALVMFTFELDQRLAEERITVNCLHPGSLLDTKMVRNAFHQAQGSAESGADAVIHLATARELEGVSGAYFDRKQPGRAHKQAYDHSAREALYRLSLDLTGLKEQDGEEYAP